MGQHAAPEKVLLPFARTFLVEKHGKDDVEEDVLGFNDKRDKKDAAKWFDCATIGGFSFARW